MKKILLIIAALCALTSCYDDYVLDYDYDAVFVAYQYDMRQVVIGEDLDLSFSVGLAGVIENKRDRAVNAVVDDNLVTGDLSVFDPKGESASFTAIDGMKGAAPFGKFPQYVATSGYNELAVLPSSYYSVNLDKLAIKKGRHTVAAPIKFDEAALAQDENAFKPYYAIGFKVLSADADTLLPLNSFQIMGIKAENKLFGNWYHGGRTQVVNLADGTVVSDTRYDRVIPQADDACYILTSVDANTVSTNMIGVADGKLNLVLNEDNTITVQDPKGKVKYKTINGQASRFNNAKTLQDRMIYLNFSFANEDGTTTYITDTLAFRNRIRDGISEWQDENPDHYKD